MRPCDRNNNHEPEGVDLVVGHNLTLTECKDKCFRHPSCNAIAYCSICTHKRCHLKNKQFACADKPCQWKSRDYEGDLKRDGWINEMMKWRWYWMSCEGSNSKDIIFIL